MTCIAWDGKTLAADRLATNAGIRRCVKKLHRLQRPDGDVLLAFTGALDVGQAMLAWYKDGALPSRFPEAARQGDATLIAISADGVRSYASGPYPMEYEAAPDVGVALAWGSGRDFAAAAMFLGRTAAQAIDVAAVFQTDVGLGVDTMRL
jgi:ATP-dependent protease HslVU (ClpYQ) peptidase subunit